MEALINQLSRRYANQPDTDYTYMLLKTEILSYVYINYCDNQYVFESKQINNDKKIKCLFNLKDNVKETLLEGFWIGNNFHITDIYFYNGEMINYGYKIRNTLIKKFLDNVINDKKSCSMFFLRTYYNTTLDNIYINVIPSLTYEVNYILMKKNINQFMIKIESEKLNNKAIENKNNNKINNKSILLKTIKKQNEKMFNVYSTDIDEIYIINHDYCYSVLRIPDLVTSKYLASIFKKGDVKCHKLSCVYNEEFSKYEYRYKK